MMKESLLRTSNEADPDFAGFLAVLRELPPLPRILRYWDDFDEELRSIAEYDMALEIPIHKNGVRTITDLRALPEIYALLIKHITWYLFSADLRPSTVSLYIEALRTVPMNEALLLISDPLNSKKRWGVLRAKDHCVHVYRSLKSLLRFACDQYLFGWSPDYSAYVQTEFPLPKINPYEGVDSGDAFLEENDERKFVAFFDGLSVAISSGTHFETRFLECAAMVMCAYQFAMRPIQIASLRPDDVKDWSQSTGDQSSIHVRFMMAKQRTSDKVLYLPRKIKNEWSSIWRVLILRKNFARKRFFDVTSNQEVASVISNFSRDTIGVQASANDFRHSAAQRLVDAGASNEELAAFMGHSQLSTGLVYYRSSSHQAELVNKALGLSPVYQRLSSIAHAKFISHEELVELKGDQQVGGVPHGIALSGIGGCSSGQPSCPYNPVTSCYGCSRFMPVTDITIHQNVLAEFRSVARFFFEESKNAVSSPAYMQLRRTISNVESIISELQEAGS